MNVDVVVPTKGEPMLELCLKHLHKNITVNNLILIAPSNIEDRLQNLSDVFVKFDEKNVGAARDEGLKFVETEYYASVDADVLVTPEWFNWCIQTIQQPKVGACQGYARHIFAKYYDKIQVAYIKRGGKHGRGFAGLGNTMLKTEVVRQVGMPRIKVEEDWMLRDRVEEAGYKWISNINVVCPHLKTDVDVWKHSVWWGSMKGKVMFRKQLKLLGRNLMKAFFIPKNRREKLFSAIINLCMLYGSFKK